MDIKQEHIKKFKRIEKQLNKLMLEICKYNSDANLYVEDAGNFNLMKGWPHDDNGNMQQENVVYNGYVHHSGGGGW